MLLLEVHVQPGAARDEVKGLHGGRLKIRLSARAVEGAANAALIEFLADQFHVPQREIEITKGLKSRNKTINIKPLSAHGVHARQAG